MKMKNKKVEQIAMKKKHRELLKSQRREEPSLRREKPFLRETPIILIVCEGKNTEPSYFKQFRLPTATIKPVGEGYNTVSLVEWAVELDKEKEYEQIWCVFDKDDFPNHNFNQAIEFAQQKKFGGNIDKAISFVRSTGLMPAMLSKSRFNRRMHRMGEFLSELFFQVGHALKELTISDTYIIDSFPVPLCHNIRISRSR
ncbi:hypothetical protein EZS27_032427, partial [termite gut metagenome]